MNMYADVWVRDTSLNNNYGDGLSGAIYMEVGEWNTNYNGDSVWSDAHNITYLRGSSEIEDNSNDGSHNYHDIAFSYASNYDDYTGGNLTCHTDTEGNMLYSGCE